MILHEKLENIQARLSRANWGEMKPELIVSPLIKQDKLGEGVRAIDSGSESGWCGYGWSRKDKTVVFLRNFSPQEKAFAYIFPDFEEPWLTLPGSKGELTYTTLAKVGPNRFTLVTLARNLGLQTSFMEYGTLRSLAEQRSTDEGPVGFAEAAKSIYHPAGYEPILLGTGMRMITFPNDMMYDVSFQFVQPTAL